MILKIVQKIIQIIIFIVIIIIFFDITIFSIGLYFERKGIPKDEQKQREMIMKDLKKTDPENKYTIHQKIPTKKEVASTLEERATIDERYLTLEETSANYNPNVVVYLVSNDKYPTIRFSATVVNGGPRQLVPFMPLVFQLGEALSGFGHSYFYNYDNNIAISIGLKDYEKNGLPYWYETENQEYPLTNKQTTIRIHQIAERMYQSLKIEADLSIGSKLSQYYEKSEEEYESFSLIFWVNEEAYLLGSNLNEGVEGIYQRLIHGERRSIDTLGARKYYQEKVPNPVK